MELSPTYRSEQMASLIEKVFLLYGQALSVVDPWLDGWDWKLFGKRQALAFVVFCSQSTLQNSSRWVAENNV